MESNPEEFSKGNRKWVTYTEALRQYKLSGNLTPVVIGLNKDELSALFVAYTQILRKEFNDSVLREVLATEEKELSYSVTTAPPVVLGNSPYNHAQHESLHQLLLTGLKETA
jgi:hypothetical protein